MSVSSRLPAPHSSLLPQPQLNRRQWLAGSMASPALLLSGCAALGREAQTADWARSQPLQLPGMRSLDLAQGTGPGAVRERLHRIMVSAPVGPRPAAGYPVIYVLDGNLMFPLLAQLVRNMAGRGQAMNTTAAVVVGIGHALPADMPTVHDAAARTYDYTPVAAGHEADNQGRPQGGADFFLDFVQHRVQPMVAQAFDIDSRSQTLVGHSYGGLCVLHTLFTRPQMFQRYVAASPSLWWGDGAILLERDGFVARPHQRALGERFLYLSQGSEEGRPRAAPTHRASPQAGRSPARESLPQLYDSLVAVERLQCSLDIWPGANHGSAMPHACMQAAAIGVHPLA